MYRDQEDWNWSGLVTMHLVCPVIESVCSEAIQLDPVGIVPVGIVAQLAIKNPVLAHRNCLNQSVIN